MGTEAEIAQHDAAALMKLDATLAKQLTPRKPHKLANELGIGEYVGEATRLLEKTPKGIKTTSHVRETSFADIVSVAPNDPARPKTVTFSHREEGSAKAHRLKQHTLTFENEREAEDFAD